MKNAPQSDAAFEAIAQRFKVLGEPTRLRLLHLIRQKERTVSELADSLEMSQPNVSKHLALLKNEGVIAPRRDGTRVYYHIEAAYVFALCDIVCEGIEADMARQRAAWADPEP